MKCGGFFCTHHEALLYMQLHYTPAQALLLHMRVKVYRKLAITSVGMQKMSLFRLENGRLLCARKYGNAIAMLLNEAIINSGATTILSMTSLSHS